MQMDLRVDRIGPALVVHGEEAAWLPFVTKSRSDSTV
jgi:hypothetical protein